MEAVIQSIANQSAATECMHCGTHFEPIDPTEEFCCSGCRFVYDLIQSEGLDRFYDLKGSSTTQPVGGRAFAPQAWGWLEGEAKNAEMTENPTLQLAVQGISCVGCVWLIENRFRNQPGALRINLSANRGIIDFTWERGKFDIVAFARELARFGYSLSQTSEVSAEHDGLTRRMALSGAFAMNAMAFTLPRYLGMPADFMFASLFEMISALSATLSMAVGGSYFITRAWHGLQAKVMHIDTPIALGIIAAYAGSIVGWLASLESLLYFDFVAVFIFLMLAGRRLQTSAMEANRQRLPSAELERATYADIHGQRRSAAKLVKGDVYKVEPSQIIPVASKVRNGSAILSFESINGEPEPRVVVDGGVAASGARYLGSSSLELVAIEPWEESMICKLRRAQHSDADSTPGFDRILRAYLFFIITAGAIGGIGWAIATGDLARALQVMISVFVVSCPCALGVAIPLADDLASSKMERIGVYVRSRNLWAKLLRVRKLLFDKTGTLTPERPQLQNSEVLTGLSSEALEALSSLVASSLHPISRSLAEHLAGSESRDGQCEEIVGQGVRLRDAEGIEWDIGKKSGHHGTCFTRDGDLLAEFHFNDTSRRGAVNELAHLTKSGFVTHILSGDAQSKVDVIATDLGIPVEHAFGELSPDDKAETIKCLGGDDALFVGDGANDSLAIREVLCSGATISDISLLQDKVDFYVLGNTFAYLTPLIDTARRRARAVRYAFGFAIAYNLVCLTIALTGHMNPLLAAILMPISSVVTALIVSTSFRTSATKVSLARWMRERSPNRLYCF